MTCASLVGQGGLGSLHQKAGNKTFIKKTPLAWLSTAEDKSEGVVVSPLTVHSARIFLGCHVDN